MKRLILYFSLVPSLLAQWTVFDPTNHIVNSTIQANEARHHLEVLAQWTQALEHLNAQVRELQAGVALSRQVRDAIGDPAGAGSRLILERFGDTEFGRSYGETLSAVRRLADAAASLRNTVDDTYAILEDRTSLGRPFARDAVRYRRFAVVERQAGTLASVQTETDARLEALRRDLSRSLAALKEAPTQAEADKLRGVIAGLNGEIAHLDAVRRNETDKLRTLQILNENQAAKERQDVWEKQAAEERDSSAVINAWQRGLKLRAGNYRR